jgi:5-methylcytosine-specific restriction protein A
MVRARSVCTTAGCPVLTWGGRCDECQAKARALRSPRKNKGRDARWVRESRRYLREHPQCECDDCLLLPAPVRPSATEVDHIDGLGPVGPRGYDWTNLRAMTKAHHARVTARSQPGGWNDRY